MTVVLNCRFRFCRATASALDLTTLLRFPKLRIPLSTKQAIGLKGNAADWRPTSNARNLAMIEEARRFSKQIKLLHKELREMEGRIEGNLVVLKGVLNSPLPRVYEMTDKGAVPVEKEASVVGMGVAFDALGATATNLKAKLQQEVLFPLDQWQAGYRMIKVRNAKCEELRLELDAKRREAAAMAASLEKLKSRAAASAHPGDVEGGKTGAGGGGSEGTKLATMQSLPPGTKTNSNKWEDAEFKLQKEEDKVARLTQRFKDIEGEVYTALLTLINDTKVLKQYAATALIVFQQAFTQAHSAFGPASSLASLGLLPTSSAALETPNAKSTAGYNGGATPASGTAAYTPKGGPDTPDQTPASQPVPQQRPPPPAWYNEAKQQAQPMQYGEDSDDDK
ncbi:hypothetical protein VOLCADRAFT_87928 [Volvox carteri f. nagariensis]|uniref:BAR domain-containing protein n=1 Tax=Volvox carteri f. nagariensis TaxID=3068 RepID=D8TML7_VOLCA|nr:uncharacterized protein VOLCADRAFT_87928 [Volvox carteri f. nagariensis]EFJ51145.1 hypothetical protein VOLCADRAFT_87928 [Volvox carteri f. nagariensis]|eukprot:XP_002947612.1 hypothetical protein VOLCADRAFT_87928 [Volvox carteri f. nagariensis]